MKILITGARGNFASALITPLIAEGHELVLLDLEPMNPPEECVAVQADIRDGAAVSHAMQGCDAVIHSVAYHNYSRDFRNYEDFYTVNVTGTHHILRSMLLHGVKALDLFFKRRGLRRGDARQAASWMKRFPASRPTFSE